MEVTRAAENEAAPTATAAIVYITTAASARYDGKYVTRIEEQLSADNGAKAVTTATCLFRPVVGPHRQFAPRD